MLPAHVEVAVVGGGPAGLALACVLARDGVDAVVLDRAEARANTSRAAVVHARTLEVLEGLGVTETMTAEGVVVPVFTVRDGRRVLTRIDFSDLPSRYPFTLMLPQWRTEEILAARLAALGPKVHRPYTVLSVTPTGSGAELAVEGPDGATQTMNARYVVGADGMHSTVRESARIDFAGSRYAQSFLLADVRLDWPLASDEVQLFFAPAGLVVVAPLPGGHHRVVATTDDVAPTLSVALVQRLLDERGPGATQVHELAWGSRFQVHHRIADAYRRGPVLLAGDAAHVHSPAGGQGMNIGIQDAIDLGESLVNVLRHGEPDGFLDRYEERRRPVAERVLALTDRATRAATVTSPAARAARNTLISVLGRVPAVQRRLASQLAELPEGRERRIAP